MPPSPKNSQLELFHLGPPKQLPLFPYENPLSTRLGPSFFSALPTSAGVYRMRDEASRLLYVGKAKNLRNRLRSYTHAQPESASPKVLRLIEKIRDIEVEVLADERSALLRENALLRELKPPYNVANTASHTYSFFHLRREPEGIRIHLAMRADTASYPDVYGAFKGLGLNLRTHRALLRLLWIRAEGADSLPAILTNRRKLSEFVVPFASDSGDETTERIEYRAVKQFFNGTAQTLIGSLERITKRKSLSPFHLSLVETDLETLREFHAKHAKRNYRLKRDLGVETPLIAQDRLDDLFVLARN